MVSADFGAAVGEAFEGDDDDAGCGTEEEDAAAASVWV
jgi:hypothetical protein